MIDQDYTGIENTPPTMEEYYHAIIEKASGTSIESSSRSLERNLNSVSRRFVEIILRKRQVNQEEIGDVQLRGITNFRMMSELLKIGQNLDRLRIDRNKVDYDDSVTGLASMVTMDLAMALNVISTLNNL